MENNKENPKFDKATDRYFKFNDALFEFNKLFNKESVDERSIAIIGGTFCEMALEYVLKSFFPEDDEVEKLFVFNNSLGNFSNKISLAYCLGLIDKLIKRDLDLIRKIRNKFAHDLFTSFHDPKIKSLCIELKFHEVSMMMKSPSGATELQVFQVCINQIISHLNGVISISKNEKRQIKNDLMNFL